MATIPLTQGKTTLVDADDYKWLNQWKWTADKIGKTWYARRNYPSKEEQKTIYKKIYMHRLILGALPGEIIDHRNNNGLDNRRKNLRFSDKKSNSANVKSYGGKSKYKGVSPRRNKWEAYIQGSEGKIHLGTFSSEVEAAKAYDYAAKKLFGQFAFPNVRNETCTR